MSMRMNLPKRRPGVAAVIAAACLVTVFFTACTGSQRDSEDAPVQATGPDKLRISAAAMSNLRFAPVLLTDFPDTQPLMGKITPTEDRTFIVQARAAGRIETVLVASGESVVAGQALGTIFSPDYIAAREEFVQSVRKNASVGGDSDFRGLAVLARKKLNSMGLTEDDTNRLEEAAKNGKSGAASAELNLLVRASRSGAIIAKSATVGNQVNLGDPLFTVADLHEVWFVGDLYPEDLPKVKKGQVVILGGTPDGKSLKGKVSFISPIIDPNTRTIKVRVGVPNPKLELRADMYLQGELVLEDKQAIAVPTNAVFRDENESYVFKVLSAKNIEGHSSGVETQRVKVALAGERQGMTSVSAGLVSGDEVVTDGALLLNSALANARK